MLGRKRSKLVNSAVAVVGFLTVVGGAIWGLGDKPPWAGVERVAQMEQYNQRTRYSMILADISRLLETKRRRALTPDEQRWLDSLTVERQQLACQLKIEKC